MCGLAVFSACDESGHTHRFGDWKVVAEPTCTEEGLRERVCTCGEKESEEIEALGHDYKGDVTIEPLCITDGEMAYTCSRCGDGYTETLEALGHDYVKGVCARCGEVEPFTEGWIFELSGDGASYSVLGYNGVSTEVYIPSYYQDLPVTSIGDWAFTFCNSLTSITIPDSVTSIGYRAFGWCSSLTSIMISDSVISIGEWAFAGCSNLTSITIPESVTSIGVGAFGDCGGLTSISVESKNQVYHSSGNCLIETQSKTLIAGCGASVIPSDGSVTSIGDCAFYGRDRLTNITIPDSVTSIGESAFRYCESLTSVTIGDGVTSIGDWEFAGCSSLTSIVIPDSVTFIGNSAFTGCDSLTTVYYRGSEAEWNEIEIGEWNDDLEDAEIVFHYKGE